MKHHHLLKIFHKAFKKNIVMVYQNVIMLELNQKVVKEFLLPKVKNYDRRHYE